jgi:hypothetical protein
MTSEAMTILPRPVQLYIELMEEISAAPPPDDLATLLARVSAATLGALTAFADSPEAVIPARRALLVAGPSQEGSEEAMDALQEALMQADQRLGAPHAGFSRLLQSALESGDLQVLPRVDVQALAPALRDRLMPLQEAAAILDALDDLSHALNAPPDLPAAACVLEAVRGALIEVEFDAPDALDEALTEWLLARGAKTRVIGLFALRGARHGLNEKLREQATEHGLAAPLALWMLGDRLGRGIGFSHTDRPELERLLSDAGLVPLGALEGAEFWDEP